MDIIDRQRTRNHPAAVLARRGAARRQVKPALVQPKALQARAGLIAEIERTWKEKFPNAHLADALVARFGKNQLEMLADDMLAGVLAAIA